MSWLDNAYKTMPHPPTYDTKIRFKRSAFEKISIIAGIDIGTTLTKIAFVDKNTDLNAEYITLRCVTYLREDFLDGILFMKEYALLPTSGCIHCTGTGTAVVIDTIRNELGLDVFFVPENISTRRGLFLSLHFAKLDDVVYPKPSHKNWEYESNYLDDFYQDSVKQIQELESENLFPAGMLSIGSGAAVALMDACGVTKFLGFIPLCGQSFVGLANLLLGTSSYEEITSLAAKGRRGKVDSQFRDIIQKGTTAYGLFPPSMPIFAFGKASKRGWVRHNVSKADIAASLVGFFAAGLMMTMVNVALATGIKRFYVCGNFARAEIVRSMMLEVGSILKNKFTVHFISLGHCGVVGSMLSTAEDTVEKWIAPDIDI